MIRQYGAPNGFLDVSNSEMLRMFNHDSCTPALLRTPVPCTPKQTSHILTMATAVHWWSWLHLIFPKKWSTALFPFHLPPWFLFFTPKKNHKHIVTLRCFLQLHPLKLHLCLLVDASGPESSHKGERLRESTNSATAHVHNFCPMPSRVSSVVSTNSLVEAGSLWPQMTRVHANLLGSFSLKSTVPAVGRALSILNTLLQDVLQLVPGNPKLDQYVASQIDSNCRGPLCTKC